MTYILSGAVLTSAVFTYLLSLKRDKDTQKKKTCFLRTENKRKTAFFVFFLTVEMPVLSTSA